MASIDLNVVRHALKTAQDHGFSEVELTAEGATFKARLQPSARKQVRSTATTPAAIAGSDSEFKLIRSPIVGFYRLGVVVLRPGATVHEGDVVAVVNALGIANDVESPVAGEIAEVLVEDGQAVEFGQVLAKVRA